MKAAGVANVAQWVNFPGTELKALEVCAGHGRILQPFLASRRPPIFGLEGILQRILLCEIEWVDVQI